MIKCVLLNVCHYVPDALTFPQNKIYKLMGFSKAKMENSHKRIKLSLQVSGQTFKKWATHRFTLKEG